MPGPLTITPVTPLQSLLADAVHDDFGPVELSLVRQALGQSSPADSEAGEAARFLAALAGVQKRTLGQAYIWAGGSLVAPVFKKRPSIARDHTSVRTLILQLSRIAPLIAESLVAECECPEFWQDFVDGETIQIGFDGLEELAWVLEGALAGASALFGERVELSRGVAPPTLLERRLLNVRVIADRRSGQRMARRGGGLSSAGRRG